MRPNFSSPLNMILTPVVVCDGWHRLPFQLLHCQRRQKLAAFFIDTCSKFLVNVGVLYTQVFRTVAVIITTNTRKVRCNLKKEEKVPLAVLAWYRVLGKVSHVGTA